MKKIIYAVVLGSLALASVAHAEDNKPPMMRGNMMMMGGATTTMMEMHGMRDIMMATSSSMMGSSTCVKFGRGLALGARGEDVKELQEMLHEKGFLNASSTGYFGKMTKEAVVKFQKDGGINPSGYFGELSRKHHEKHCGEGMGMMMGDGKGDDGKMGSSTMPVPCMTSASASGCEHSNAFPPFMMGTGTPNTSCTTKFDPMTGKLCHRENDDHAWSSTTPPVIPPPATTTASTTAN